jgi:CRISPR-associated protein Cas2
MSDEHLILVTYDIADERRWRQVFKLMHGYGEWTQLSVFQCRLTRMRQIELVAKLGQTIAHAEDHVLVLDLGLADHPGYKAWANAASKPLNAHR